MRNKLWEWIMAAWLVVYMRLPKSDADVLYKAMEVCRTKATTDACMKARELVATIDSLLHTAQVYDEAAKRAASAGLKDAANEMIDASSEIDIQRKMVERQLAALEWLPDNTMNHGNTRVSIKTYADGSRAVDSWRYTEQGMQVVKDKADNPLT